MNQKQILRRLDKMVAAGRITETEAAQIRAAENSAASEATIGEVRARHAGARMEDAVATGEMTEDEASGYLDQLRTGDHPKGLRARLGAHRRGLPRRHQPSP